MFKTVYKRALFIIIGLMAGMQLGHAQCEVSFGYRKAGKTVKFINTSDVSPDNVNRFVWSFGNGERSRRENPVHVFKTGAVYNVCLVVEDTSCGPDPKRYCSEITIAGDSTDCKIDFETRQQGDLVRFVNKSSIRIVDATKFVWVFGDGERSGEPSPVHEYKKPGTYRACLAVKADVCGSEYLKTCKPVRIEPDSMACKLSFRWRQRGVTAKFINTSELIDRTQTYWDFGDGITSMEKNPNHTYTHEGTYRVCLITSDSLCGKPRRTCERVDVDKQLAQVVTPDNDLTEAAFSFKLYPNPVRNTMYLESLDWGEEKVSVKIFNTLGEEVFNKSYKALGTISVKLDGLRLFDGIYLIEMRTDKAVGLEKFVYHQDR